MEADTREIRLLHTADVHLDYPFLYLGDKRTDRRKDVIETFSRLIDLAIEKSVAALLICGDLYDNPRAESANWVKAQFDRLAGHGIKVLVIPGNHDIFPDCKAYLDGFPSNVHVFLGEEFTIYKGVEGVTFYGIPFMAKDRGRRVLRGFAREGLGGGFHVALVHGQFGTVGEVEENYGLIDPEDIKESGLDYIALGHYHSFKDCSCGMTRAFYPGSPNRLDFKDKAERKVILVTLKVVRMVEVEPMPVEDRKYVLLEKDCSEVEAIYRELNAVTDGRSCVKVRLTGFAGDRAALVIDDLREKYASRFFGFDVEDETAPDLALSGPGEERTVLGVFRRKVKELMDKAGTEEERARLHMVYRYGLAALKGGRLP